MHLNSLVCVGSNVVTEHCGILRYIVNNIKAYPFKGKQQGSLLMGVVLNEHILHSKPRMEFCG